MGGRPTLENIFAEQHETLNHHNCEIPLLKAMLAHSATWGEAGERLKAILKTQYDGHRLRKLVANWLGYGVPDINKVLHCNQQRATLIGFGELLDGGAHIYNLPLPPSLSAKRVKRKLTITLAWISPIAANTQKYRVANLWFDAPNSESIASERVDVHSGNVRKGTLQHEIFEGEKANPFLDGDVMKIKINCLNDAAKIQNPIAYGLFVSLEVAENIDISIYNEISNKIKMRAEIKV